MNQDGENESEEQIYDIAPCGFFSADQNGTIIKANQTFALLAGYEKEEIIHKLRWQDLLTIGGKIYHETHYFPLLKLHGTVKEINFDIVRKDGSRIPVLVNSVLFEVKIKGKPEKINHSSVLDITQRKQYEKELLIAKQKAEELVNELSAANAELEQFAYIVSHDLQAPLAEIKGYVQILQLNGDGKYDEETFDIFQRITVSIERMTRLIHDLLEYSRLQKKKKSHEAIDLNEVWANVLSTFELSIEKNNARIIAPKLPVVIGNKTQLTRLFQNLLSNSLKYRSEKDPRIEITFEQEADKWKFYFKDNGLGFDQKQAKKLFKFFQRFHKKKASGTGIGLVATKQIVEMHGGEIGATSEPGKGSTFIFTLPIYKGGEENT